MFILYIKLNKMRKHFLRMAWVLPKITFRKANNQLLYIHFQPVTQLNRKECMGDC